jgi:hypothetical protein
LDNDLGENDISEIRKTFKGQIFDLNVFDLFLHSNKNLSVYRIIKKSFGLKHEEIDLLQGYVNVIDYRLKQLFNYAIYKGSSIMIDAEQTYLQSFIDYLIAYYYKIYNIESCMLWKTVQCYLKNEIHSLKKWRQFCDENKLKLGVKLVRGAYMNEENSIAELKGLPSVICDSYEENNKNYNCSVQYLFENYKKGDKVINN